MKVFVSYTVNRLNKEGKPEALFGNTVIETVIPDSVTFDDIRSAENSIAKLWKAVSATVIHFNRLDG